MTSHKQANGAKVGVRISRETGGAYADVREVIQSELRRIRSEQQSKADSECGMVRDSDNRTNGNRDKKH
ncbi:MAG: hypothetical protein QOH41_3706 [Blastocatellia bacterium]|jgi:hypothetical protein|nr:hypothetical protein [Blastocatellia bacterium]